MLTSAVSAWYNQSSAGFHPSFPRINVIQDRIPFSQFVNHVFNSQQLSNKALLADHLAFQHDRRGKQCLDGSGTEPCAGLFFLAPGCERTKGRNKLEKNTHEGSTMNPDAFFPRCFNMQDGALSGLIEAFIVSAAAALLRRIIQGKVSFTAGYHSR